VRLGANSPYIDIRLPCGGGMDLLFNPRPDRRAIADALSQLDARKTAALRLSRHGVYPGDVEAPCPGWRSDSFDISYVPAFRMVAIGQGDDLTGLARLSHSFGAEVVVLTPDRRALAELADQRIEAIELVTRTSLPQIQY
jgi:xanthine dehydrogenase accessory factor